MASEPNNLIALRQEFHQFPELGFNENRTKTRISGILKDLGLEVHEGLGVVGILRAGKGNRAIALRADMDELPIKEASDHDYLSQNAGVMQLLRPLLLDNVRISVLFAFHRCSEIGSEHSTISSSCSWSIGQLQRRSSRSCGWQ